MILRIYLGATQGKSLKANRASYRKESCVKAGPLLTVSRGLTGGCQARRSVASLHTCMAGIALKIEGEASKAQLKAGFDLGGAAVDRPGLHVVAING